jgi:hypothetical protein
MVDGAKPPVRRRRLKVVVLSLVGLVAVFALYQYLFVWRLSTRGPALAAGIVASDFSLPDEAGRSVPLAALTAQGPAVLVFYRGYW